MREPTSRLRRVVGSTAAVLVACLLPAVTSPAVAADTANGLTITVTHIEPAVVPDPGAVTVTVTNHADPGGATQNFTVWAGGNGYEQTQRVTVADGATSGPLTFKGTRGTWSVCADGDTLVPVSETQSTTPHGCVEVTVPDGTAAAYTGQVVYGQRCEGLRLTVTNTGSRTADFSVATSGAHLSSFVEVWRLKVGESRSDTLPRYWGAHVEIEVDGPWVRDDRAIRRAVNTLPSATWQPPAACPMTGSTRLVKWLPKMIGEHPAAVIRTRAFCPQIGFQIKGRKKIDWSGAWRTKNTHETEAGLHCPPHGRHKVEMMGHWVRPGSAVTLRLWVRYVDDSASSAGRGRARFTGWYRFIN